MFASRRMAGATMAAATLSVAAVCAAATPCVTPQAQAAEVRIKMSGSTSIAPLARSLASAYDKRYPTRAKFTLLQGGSDIGITDVARRRADIGNASRDPQSGDPGGLVFNRIARDGVCIVTHPDNTLLRRGHPAGDRGAVALAVAPLVNVRRAVAPLDRRLRRREDRGSRVVARGRPTKRRRAALSAEHAGIVEGGALCESGCTALFPARGIPAGVRPMW